MKYTTRIYDLVINQQEPLIELLTLLVVKDPIDKIRDILDEQLFEVVECDNNQIIKIRKRSTGECFKVGTDFYHKKYKSWHKVTHFDHSLFGYTHKFSDDSFKYYKNYLNGTGGMYHINDISLTDEEIIVNCCSNPELTKTRNYTVCENCGNIKPIK